VDLIAECVQLNLAHETKTKNASAQSVVGNGTSIGGKSVGIGVKIGIRPCLSVGVAIMESELVRLASYMSFPLTQSRLCPSRLSRLGFHYDSTSDSVVCHRCRFSADLRSIDDDIDLNRRHHQQSTVCRHDPPDPRDLVLASRDVQHMTSLPRELFLDDVLILLHVVIGRIS